MHTDRLFRIAGVKNALPTWHFALQSKRVSPVTTITESYFDNSELFLVPQYMQRVIAKIIILLLLSVKWDAWSNWTFGLTVCAKHSVLLA